MDNRLRVCLLGCPSVGKSSITQQVVSQNFPRNYNPTIEDTYVTTINYNNTDVKYRITDTMGYEHTTIPERHMIGMHAFIAVFDISNRRSFETSREICDELLDSINWDIQTYPIILVGNKLDLLNEPNSQLGLDERNTMEQIRIEAREFVADRSLTKYVEITAKRYDQVIDIFNELTPLIIDVNDDLQQVYRNLRPRLINSDEKDIQKSPQNNQGQANETQNRTGITKNPECRLQ